MTRMLEEGTLVESKEKLLVGDESYKFVLMKYLHGWYLHRPKIREKGRCQAL